MSNFVNIAIDYVIFGIELFQKYSISQDNSLSNQTALKINQVTMNFFNLGRDVAFAKTKRDILDNLILTLRSLPQQPNNTNKKNPGMLFQIKKAIADTRIRLSQISLSQKPNEGQTHTALLKLENFAQLFSEKILRADFPYVSLDKSSKELLAYLDYYALKFFAQNIFSKLMREYSSVSLDNYLDNDQLNTLKESLLISEIKRCHVQLTAMSKSDLENIWVTKLEAVKFSIEEILRESKKYEVTFIPLARIVDLKTDYLSTFMSQASQELDELHGASLKEELCSTEELMQKGGEQDSDDSTTTLMTPQTDEAQAHEEEANDEYVMITRKNA